MAENEHGCLSEESSHSLIVKNEEINNINEINTIILNSSPIGIVAFQDDGKCILANEAIARIIGTDKATVMRQRFQDIISWRESGMIKLADKTLATGDETYGEFNINTTYGKNVWLEIRFVRFYINGEKHLLQIVSDMTEKKLAEESVKLFFDTTVDMLCIAGFDGYFKELSPTWTATLGWSIAELKARPFIDFVHPDDVEGTLAAAAGLSEGNRVINFENRYLTKDGSYRWIAWNSYGHKERQLIIAAARDMTDKTEALELLRIAKDEAERADRAKSEFIANMSHEIRTPLNAIIGFSEILAQVISDVRQKSYIDSIASAGRSLLELINDILDLSKVEAGMMELQLGPVRFKNVLEEIERIFIPRLQSKNLLLSINIDEDVPEWMLLDEMRLRQVLLNLVGNAVKFTDQGRIDINVSAKHQKKDKQEEIELRIDVKDTGIGISKEDFDRIFESFRQQSGQSNRKYEGTGLGLSISKRLVELMKGSISLKSELGMGSTFTVLLPDIVVPSYVVKNNDEENIEENIMFTSGSVMVVDDVDSNRFLFREILTLHGLRVSTAENGFAALKLLETSLPELILLDIRMPELDGIALNRRIKSNEKTASIPVIAVSASMQPEDVSLFEREGFVAYLEKPVSTVRLLGELKKYFSYKSVIQDFSNNEMEKTKEYFKLNDIGYLTHERLAFLADKIKTYLRLRDVLEFARILRDLDAEYEQNIFSVYADDLVKVAESFDMNGINDIIKRVMEKMDKAVQTEDVE